MIRALPAARRLGVLLAAVGLLLAGGRADAGFVIGGVNYEPTAPTETVIAPFATPDGGLSTNLFSGLVLVTVAGTGQSFEARENDAFYVSEAGMQVPNDEFYQLVVTKTGSVLRNSADNARENIVYDVALGTEVTPAYLPAYRADSTYSFVLDTSRLGGPAVSALRFGVNDGRYDDNTGAYTVTVTQLAPADPTTATPLPASAVVLAPGAVGLAGVRRRRA